MPRGRTMYFGIDLRRYRISVSITDFEINRGYSQNYISLWHTMCVIKICMFDEK